MGGPAQFRKAGPPAAGETGGKKGADHALRVTVREELAEIVGAVLMEVLGSFEIIEPQTVEAVLEPADLQPGDVQAVDAQLREEQSAVSVGDEGLTGAMATLIFYPPAEGEIGAEQVFGLLPEGLRQAGGVRVESCRVPRDWVDGWKTHFHPTVIGTVRVRPPWEAPAAAHLVDVTVNPGLGFGTGLHPTTRGMLLLLQTAGACGSLVDVGTGSGILAVAAAKLGWAPVIAFDNDPLALLSARENVKANGVGETVQLYEMDLTEAPMEWFAGATVLANLTLGPVLALFERLQAVAESDRRPRRLIVSGILAGRQEEELLGVAWPSGWACGGRLCEEEWVALELVPVAGGDLPCTVPGSW